MRAEREQSASRVRASASECDQSASEREQSASRVRAERERVRASASRAQAECEQEFCLTGPKFCHKGIEKGRSGRRSAFSSQNLIFPLKFVDVLRMSTPANPQRHPIIRMET